MQHAILTRTHNMVTLSHEGTLTLAYTQIRKHTNTQRLTQAHVTFTHTHTHT